MSASLSQEKFHNGEKSKSKNLDEIYKSIRSYGYYQMFFFTVMQYACWIQASIGVASFLWLGSFKPTYICHDEGHNFTINPKDYSQQACHMMKNCTNLEIKNAWVSVAQTYEFICGSEWLMTNFVAIMPVFAFFAYMCSGHLIDYFGRKWIMVIGFGVDILAGFAMALAPSFGWYIAFYVIYNAADSIYVGAQFPLIVESVNSKYRLIQGFAFQYSVGNMIGCVIALLTKDWRTHMFIVNGMGILAFLMMLFLQESPRFLIQKKKYEEAAKVINRIAWFNKRPARYKAGDLMDIQVVQTQKTDQTTDQKRYTFLDLFSNWRLVTYAAAQMVTGYTLNLVTNVVQQDIQGLAGDPFVNVICTGAFRIWCPFAAYAMENSKKEPGFKSLSRKKFYIIIQASVASLLLPMFVVKLFDLNEGWKLFGSYSLILGSALLSGLVSVIYKVYTTELFPTVMRSIALNTFSSTSLTGSVTAPYLVDLKRYWAPLPFCGVFVSSGLAGILAVIFLPETKFVALPDTVVEAIQREKLPVDDSDESEDEEGKNSPDSNSQSGNEGRSDKASTEEGSI